MPAQVNVPVSDDRPDTATHPLPPLAVDLDGTLTVTGTFHESVIARLTRSPLLLFWLLRQVLAGRSAGKHAVGRRVSLDTACLPYNRDL